MKTVRKFDFKVQKKSQGFTLIELVLVVGGGAALVALGLLAFSSYQSGQRALQAKQQITQMSAAIRSIFPAPNYSGLTSAAMVDSKKLNDMVSGTDLVNAFGEVVTLAPGAGNRTFVITYPGVEDSSCTEIVTGSVNNYISIEVGSGGTNVFTKENAPVAAITAACTAASETQLILTAS